VRVEFLTAGIGLKRVHRLKEFSHLHGAASTHRL
jgi:hypothetical protein